MCSCFQCSSHVSGESVRSDTERLHTFKMSGHGRWLSSPWKLRTGRPFKGHCLITASVAFCIGVGMGFLISLYFLPLTSDSTPPLQRPYDKSSFFKENFEVTMPTLTTTPSESASILIINDSTKHPPSVDSFPQFPHIENLLRDRATEEVEKKKDFENSVRPRPNSNVQFIIPSPHRLLPLQPNLLQMKRTNSHVQDVPATSPSYSGESESENASVPLGLNSPMPFEPLDGIYWSEAIEAQLPHGFTDTQVQSWRDFVQTSPVLRIEEGCGRMQNRLLTLANETRACCRYRQNSDQIQGEIFSFYLSQLLEIRNLAPSVLSLIKFSTSQWTSVREDLSLAQWVDEKPVVFTQFIPSLSSANIPTPFRDSRRSLHPPDVFSSLQSLDTTQLAQWSDLIVFDYLTGNLDRVVNNLYNLQWNPSMMEAPAHNLARETRTGLLVFLDNESGLLHGYRLLDKYEHFHRLMLDSLCVFRRPTANAIKRLFHAKNIGPLLKEMFTKFESRLLDYLPMLPDKSLKILNHRIRVVHDQILRCESLYNS